jgi:hypothetical protein
MNAYDPPLLLIAATSIMLAIMLWDRWRKKHLKEQARLYDSLQV